MEKLSFLLNRRASLFDVINSIHYVYGIVEKQSSGSQPFRPNWPSRTSKYPSMQ